MWRLISDGKFGLTFRPSQTASCRPKSKAMPDVVVRVVCRLTCAASREGKCEASRKAGCSVGTSGVVTVRSTRFTMEGEALVVHRGCFYVGGLTAA
jgi:hypothetical protein